MGSHETEARCSQIATPDQREGSRRSRSSLTTWGNSSGVGGWQTTT